MKAAVHVSGGLLARNTVVNAAGQLIPLAVAAAALPLLARRLGPDRLGLLSLAWAVLTLFGDIGFGRAATKLAADALGRGEAERVAPVAWATALVQAAIGVAAGVLLAAATPLLVARGMHVPPALEQEARWGFYVLAAGLPIVVVATAFRGMLEAAQQFIAINAVRVPVTTATFFLPLVSLALGWHLAGTMVLLLLARLVSLGIYFWLALRTFPQLLDLRGTRREIGPVTRFGAWSTVSTVVSSLLVYIDRFALSAVVSVAALAYYTPPIELATRLLVIPFAATLTLFPAFSTLAALEQGERLHRLVAQTSKYVLLAVGPLLVALAVGAHDILQLWLGAEFARQGTVALQVLTVGVAINAIGYVLFALVQGVGRPDLSAKFHLVELPLHLALSLLLIRAWGIPGAALAWSIRVTLDTGLLFYAAARASALSRRALLAERVPQTVGLLLLFAVLAAAATRVLDAGAMRLGAITLMLPLMAGALWYLALAAPERARLRSALLLPGRAR